MDLPTWETLNAASGAGASFMAKAASHFQKVTGNFTSEDSADSATKVIKPFAKDDKNEEAWIMGRKYFTQSGTDFIILFKHPFEKQNSRSDIF